MAPIINRVFIIASRRPENEIYYVNYNTPVSATLHEAADLSHSAIRLCWTHHKHWEIQLFCLNILYMTLYLQLKVEWHPIKT